MTDEGRRERFRVAYDANYSRILGYALRRTASAEDAADVVSETFTIAWRRIEDLPSGTEARLWLYGIARRVLANHHRGERRRSRLAERITRDVSAAMPAPDRGLAEGVDGIVEAFRRLRERDREILGLVAWEGLGRDELAKVLGCSTTAAKVRLHRARKRFAQQLAASGVPLKPGGSTGHEDVGKGSPNRRIREAR